MFGQVGSITQVVSFEVLLTIASGSALAIVFFFISPVVLKYILEYISTESLDFNQERFIGNVRWAISFTFVASSLIVVLQNRTFLMTFDNILRSLLLTALILLWIRVAQNLGQYAIDKIVTIRYDESIIPIVENVWTLLMLVAAVFLSFDVWDIDITPLLASAGIAGVVLGLAARETISNFFGSIALYADDAYQTGDYISLTDGNVEGYVNDISIRSTQIVTLAGNKIIIPNSKLHNSIIENKSAPEDQYRTILKFGVSYDAETDKAERAIRRGVESVIESEESYVKSWFFGGTDSYKVFLHEFGDSSIVFKVFAKVRRPEDEPRIRSRMFKRVRDELNDDGIKIPYPQRSVHLEDRDDPDDISPTEPSQSD